MEYQVKRIRHNSAITMQIRTIQTMRLAGRTVTTTQTSVIRITQLTAVAELKIINKTKPPTEIFPSAGFHILILFFLINSSRRFIRFCISIGRNRSIINSASVIFKRLAILVKVSSNLSLNLPTNTPENA